MIDRNGVRRLSGYLPRAADMSFRTHTATEGRGYS
jgi:hypothetical protein